MKIYRRHNCRRHHRHWYTLAECVWPHAVWVSGTGQYATVAWCRALTVMLHEDLDTARKAMSQIAETGCGGECRNNHELVKLDIPVGRRK